LQTGAEPDIFIWGTTGEASFATRGAVNGLCRTFRKRPEKFWGGQAKFWGDSGPPGTLLAPPLVAELYTTCPGERVLVSTKFNVTFLPLRICYVNTSICFSKDAENLTTYGYML